MIAVNDSPTGDIVPGVDTLVCLRVIHRLILVAFKLDSRLDLAKLRLVTGHFFKQRSVAQGQSQIKLLVLMFH